MELVECIEKRISVRSFSDDDVPEEVVSEALRLAQLAPSAGNLQARDFIIVRDPETKRKLSRAAFGQAFIEEAPVVIVCCANLNRIRNYGARGTDLYCLQDVAASVENIMLYVCSQGFGSCWVGAFDEAEACKALQLPGHARPIVLIPIGRPREQGSRTPRLKLDTVTHNEKW
ncbi:MAG TPA: nitroreductase family protein [Methanomassiliicoccales archaeon]|nr:nitroreductase family protein [Methanomassiliicoccales archaeon]